MFGPHALRATAATNALEHDCDIAKVQEWLRPRLLLCLHGLGTNAGLQRMASLGAGVTTKDLAYVRHRYISVPTLREAIAIVANGTLAARNPAIWGDANGSS
jgi:hypothetical protein